MKRETKIHHKKQKKYFQKDLRIYKDYHENLNAWRKSYIGRINESLLDKSLKNKTLIDIGAGSGYVSVEMAKLGIKVYACDITQRAIRNLSEYKKNFKLKNLYVLRSQAERIPLPDKSVDYIVANAILEHVPDEGRAISEWKRILKPKGRVFITAPIKYKYMWPFFWPVNYIHDRILGHLRRYDLKDLKAKFDMQVKKVYYTGHFAKTAWLVISRILVLDLRKNLRFDEYFEKYDLRLERVAYGASNIIAVLQKKNK